MKFCKSCGHPLKDEAKVCSQCGEQVQKSTRQMNEQPQRKKPSVSLSKKQKLTLLVSAGVFVVAFITYQITTNIFDQHRAVDQFEEALIEGNTEQLAATITSGDPGMEIEQDDLQGLVQYMEGNASFLNEEMTSLRQQAELMDDETEEVVANPVDHSLFQLKPEGKNWFIFDAYSFEVPSFYVNITTNEADTVIYLDEEEIAIADEEDFSREVGPFAPGQYTLTAELDHDYVTLEREEELDLIAPPQDSIQVDLTLNGEYIYLDSNEPEAEVYVNGDALDRTVEQLDSELGPVVTDGSMTVHAEHEYPWGTVSSEEEEITGTNMFLEIPAATDELMDQVMDTVNEYVPENDGDIWNGELESIVYDLDTFSVENIEGQYTATFEAVVHYDDDEESFSGGENHQKFSVVYDTEDEDWLMDDYYSTPAPFNYAPTNTEEFTGTSESGEDGEDSSETTINDSELEEFIYEVNEASAESINSQEFSLVEDLMTSDGPRAPEHEDYIDYLAEENITQTHVETSLESVETVSEEEWEVTTIEVYDIHRDDGTETTEFRTISTVKLVDGDLKVDALQSTDEI
ncbi:zinc ribbon domain-containing protein [Salicibibacter kimchii]|uniref:Zinc-ribbon domain-containing protein n=1 Tax=Salicibibacter kimchii TaxID=2099786 RepID=A0A345BWC0_9BACI|nr:zinc-ribbon domain-containing protein [Salicibibacter kimchii]AXF55251.1 zinc-ribbon domain-containing protein [Salicibibacter kimchii]